MQRFLLVAAFFCLIFIKGFAIDLKVGQTKTLSFSAPTHLTACQWTISRPYDVVFTTSPGSLATSVEIKAINSFPATSPCIVQCTYYYLELDPATGRYIYQRSDYKRWTIFVSNNGSGGGGENPPSGKKIELSSQSIEIKVGEEAEVSVKMSDGGQYLRWSIDDSEIARYESLFDGWKVKITGFRPGTTTAKVINAGGGTGSLKVTVKPNTYKDGQYVKYVLDGYTYSITVDDAYNKKGTIDFLSSKNTNIIKQYQMPSEVFDLTITKLRRVDPKMKIQKIILPNTLEKLESPVFENCSYLEDIVLPSSIDTISNYAFSRCTNLKRVMLPYVNYIDWGGFSGCTNLKYVYLAEGMDYLSEQVFANCSSLESIILPNKLSEIGRYAFLNCSKLKSIKIPDNVKTIRTGAFNDCTALESVTLPKSLIGIGDFVNCKNIKEVTYLADNPTTHARTTLFENNVYETAILVVADVALEKIKLTSPWNLFKHIVTTSDIKDIEIDERSAREPEIYTISGVKVTVPESDLPAGIYIYNDGVRRYKKMIIK